MSAASIVPVVVSPTISELVPKVLNATLLPAPASSHATPLPVDVKTCPSVPWSAILASVTLPSVGTLILVWVNIITSTVDVEGGASENVIVVPEVA